MKLREFKDGKGWRVERQEAYQVWKMCNNWPLPLEVVQAYELCHIRKGRETEIRKMHNSAPDGQDGYMLWALKTKYKHRIDFATVEECKRKGVEPGPYNLFSGATSNKQRRKNKKALIKYVAEQVRQIASDSEWSVVGNEDTKVVEFKHDESARVVTIKVTGKSTHESSIVDDKPFLSVGTDTYWEHEVRVFLQGALE